MSLTKRIARAEPAAPGVLGQVRAGRDADRRADQHGEPAHEDAADERVEQPAVGRPGAASSA